MFDVAPSEFLLVIIVALVVIGPKDLPRVLRTVGKWVGKARSIAVQFRSGFDDMVREAELADLEKKWKQENDRIMREHPPESEGATPQADYQDATSPHSVYMTVQPDLLDDTPVVAANPTPKKPRKKAAS
jgi:sec-independent protein translocase protein TatB